MQYLTYTYTNSHDNTPLLTVTSSTSEPALSPNTSFMSFVKGSNSAFNSSILGGSMYSLSYLLPPLNITNQIQSKG